MGYDERARRKAAKSKLPGLRKELAELEKAHIVEEKPVEDKPKKVRRTKAQLETDAKE